MDMVDNHKQESFEDTAMIEQCRQIFPYIAVGLGKHVIWCVRDADLKDIHFDNRQFNFLQWKPNEIGEFREALKFRIESILGKGPVKLREK